MNEITSDAGIMAALGRQMTRAVQRQMVAAGNLANADTPGYRTREISFADALDDQMALTKTTAGQAAGAATGQSAVVSEASGLPERRDGNNVQMDHELLALGKASGDFNAAQTVLAAKFRLVRYAINDGR